MPKMPTSELKAMLTAEKLDALVGILEPDRIRLLDMLIEMKSNLIEHEVEIDTVAAPADH